MGLGRTGGATPTKAKNQCQWHSHAVHPLAFTETSSQQGNGCPSQETQASSVAAAGSNPNVLPGSFTITPLPSFRQIKSIPSISPQDNTTPG